MGKILTTVTLSRYKTDKWGLPIKLLERRIQPSRSFTIGFIDQLYTMMAKVAYTTPYAGGRNIDQVLVKASVAEFSSYNQGGVQQNMQVTAPGGAGVIMPYIYSNAGITYLRQLLTLAQGCDVGIQVGTDNTPATPSDRRLVKRIGHGTRAADGGSVAFEEYTTGDDASADIAAATHYLGQGFTPKYTHELSSVLVQIYKAGAPGDLSVRIRGADHLISWLPPTGTYCNDLATGTIAEGDIPAASPGALTECTLAAPVTVYAGRRYYIILNAPGAGGANHVYWRYDNTSPTYQRCPSGDFSQGCQTMASSDTGASFTSVNSKCYMFREKGQSVGEFVHSGTEVRALAVAAPSATFVIQKYFYNGSGGSISVQEAGIHAIAFHDNAVAIHTTSPVLIARDVVNPAVAVANTELLVVTYTPSITV